MAESLLVGMPTAAPKPPTGKIRFIDIAVTATAKDFAGFYRGKQYHEPDVLAMLDRGLAADVEHIILTGMSMSDIDFNLKIAHARSKQCRITVGVHPYHAAEPENDAGYLDELLHTITDTMSSSPNTIAAFGELGLDYDHLEHASKEVQMQTFRRQMELYISHGLNHKLPLFLHCRAAFEDFVGIMAEYLPQLLLPAGRKGVVHSFVGSTEQMNDLTRMGFDISVNGFSLRDKESINMVAAIPIERLQLETDAPWGEIPANSEVAKRYLVHARPLPPSKKRDKFEIGLAVKGRNESFTIDRVAYIVAGLQGIDVDFIIDAAWTNSSRMFGLDQGR